MRRRTSQPSEALGLTLALAAWNLRLLFRSGISDEKLSCPFLQKVVFNQLFSLLVGCTVSYYFCYHYVSVKWTIWIVQIKQQGESCIKIFFNPFFQVSIREGNSAANLGGFRPWKKKVLKLCVEKF